MTYIILTEAVINVARGMFHTHAKTHTLLVEATFV